MPFRGKGYRPPRYTPKKSTPPRSSGNDAYKYRSRGYRAAPPPIQDERQEAVAAYGNAQYERQIRVNPMLANISQQSNTAFKGWAGSNPIMQKLMGYKPKPVQPVTTGGAREPSHSYLNRYEKQLRMKGEEKKNEAQSALDYAPGTYPEAAYDPYGGYGGYYGGGGGGGGGSYSGYSQPFSQYQRGYAAQGSQAPAAMGMRTAPQAQAYRSNYAVANQQARWLSLLTNWRI